MLLTVIRGYDSALIMRDESVVAEIKLDYLEQTDAVIIYPNASEEETESAIRLAGSHARNFVLRRQMPARGNLMNAEHRNYNQTREDSARYLTFESVDEAMQAAPIEEIEQSLKEICIPIIRAVHSTAEEAIRAAVNDPRLTVKISFEMHYRQWDENPIVTFKVRKKDTFCFWRSVSMPFSDGSWDLHVVPAYHPVRDPKRGYALIINGDTDYCIRGEAVQRIHAPQHSRTRDGFGNTWSYVNHPFRVRCHGFDASIVRVKALSKEGVEEIVKMLLSALEHDGKYITVAGGFRAPDDTPVIRYPGKRLGSEEFCYWARSVLEQEGALQGAHIPRWMR